MADWKPARWDKDFVATLGSYMQTICSRKLAISRPRRYCARTRHQLLGMHLLAARATPATEDRFPRQTGRRDMLLGPASYV